MIKAVFQDKVKHHFQMIKRRKQLTLFVQETEAAIIDAVRREFNPEQYHLIKSHVTLCRENELEQIEKVTETLSELKHSCITIQFGEAIRFSDGKGVLLPATGDNETFHQLRKIALQPINEKPVKHQPHITLMHPRNSTCTDQLFEQIKKYQLPHQLSFTKISLIEQEYESKWHVLKEFYLT